MATIQSAAHAILREEGSPLPSKELARRALERGMVYSSAQRPIDSLAQTIEKNIREGYKNPELAFIRTISGRQICLPEWSGRETRPLQDRDEKLDLETITVRVPTDLADQLRLAAQSKLWPDFDSTVADLVGKGLHLERQRIKDALLKLLDS